MDPTDAALRDAQGIVAMCTHVPCFDDWAVQNIDRADGETTAVACVKRQSAERTERGWFKPRDWYQRSDAEGPQDACSRACIERIADASGKTRVVLPL